MALSVCVLHVGGDDLGYGWPQSRRVSTDINVGFPASYGVFQEFYSTNDFAGSSNIAVVGTCAMVRQ